MRYYIKSEIIVRLWTIRLVALTSQNRTFSRKSPTPLPPLEKGEVAWRQGTSLNFTAFLWDISDFYKLLSRSAVKTVGIAPRQHHQWDFPHYPLPRTKLASLVKGEVLSPEKIRATTGGIAPHPHHQLEFPHYPTHFSLGEGLCVLIWFYIRTIPPTFRRARGLPLPLHQSLLFSLIFAKEHLSLALLAPPETSL